MEQPLVDIVVPVYNTMHRLDKCIESILRQTYKKIHLILVDDGSTDQSGYACERYTEIDARVMVLHIPNGGVSNARNIGIENANGQYLMFVDSDDTVEPDLVEKLCLEACQSGADYVTSGMDSIYVKNGRQVSRSRDIPDCFCGSIMEFVAVFEKYTKYLNSPCKSLFKTALINDHRIRFIPSIRMGEDKIFVSQYISHSDSICVIPYSGYCYYIDRDKVSLTSSKDLRVADYAFESAEARTILFEICGFTSGDLEYSKQFYGEVFFHLARIFGATLCLPYREKYSYCRRLVIDGATRKYAQKYGGFDLKSRFAKICIVHRMSLLLFFAINAYVRLVMKE